MEPSNASHGWDGKMASDEDSEDDDYRPARTAFHEDPAVCTYMLGTVTAKVPLKIAASKIASPGSGLFVTKDIMDGEEIFRSQIPFVCVEPYQTTVCHYCLEDTGSRIHHVEDRFYTGDEATAATKRCSGCRVARFCSMVSSTGRGTYALCHGHADSTDSRLAIRERGKPFTKTSARY